MKKYLIFDAGPIISLTMNGLLPVLEKLKENFNGEFIITPEVKREVIDKPLKIKKYQLEAVRVQNLIKKGIFTLSSKLISNNKLQRETKQLLQIANSTLVADQRMGNEKINLIQDGEASCLAFSKLCKCENVIVADERTIRMLTEAPEKLKEVMEKKLHTKISINHQNLKYLKNFKFIRSAELLYVAYKKDLIGLKKDKTLLDALLYAVKYKGSAISSKEIEEIKSLV